MSTINSIGSTGGGSTAETLRSRFGGYCWDQAIPYQSRAASDYALCPKDSIGSGITEGLGPCGVNFGAWDDKTKDLKQSSRTGRSRRTRRSRRSRAGHQAGRTRRSRGTRHQRRAGRSHGARRSHRSHRSHRAA